MAQGPQQLIHRKEASLIVRKQLTAALAYEVLSAVSEIPEGLVATYGQIARLIGRDQNARLVAKILSTAGLYGDYPCHRVVNHTGRLAPSWSQQRLLLEQEGVSFRSNGCVNMQLHAWNC